MSDLIRLVLTSWSFFDRPGDLLRTRLTFEKNQSPVEECLWPVKTHRQWWRIFFNPAGNDYYYSKQLEARAALLSQQYQTQPDFLLRSHEFRKYIDHVSESIGLENFDSMKLRLEVKKLENKNFTLLLELTLPIAVEAQS